MYIISFPAVASSSIFSSYPRITLQRAQAPPTASQAESSQPAPRSMARSPTDQSPSPPQTSSHCPSTRPDTPCRKHTPSVHLRCSNPHTPSHNHTPPPAAQIAQRAQSLAVQAHPHPYATCHFRHRHHATGVRSPARQRIRTLSQTHDRCTHTHTPCSQQEHLGTVLPAPQCTVRTHAPSAAVEIRRRLRFQV
ncbi:hypothetical protein ABW21_db0201802 [Orbilia brochopaga]|nr:hypothetical protein ABW21_db0201802 [Drechslerella brochopaga]